MFSAIDACRYASEVRLIVLAWPAGRGEASEVLRAGVVEGGWGLEAMRSGGGGRGWWAGAVEY